MIMFKAQGLLADICHAGLTCGWGKRIWCGGWATKARFESKFVQTIGLRVGP